MGRTFRTALLAAPLLIGVWLAAPGAAQVEIPPILESPTPTPSPSPSPDPDDGDGEDRDRDGGEDDRDEPRPRDRNTRRGDTSERARRGEPELPPEVARGLAVWRGRLDERTPSHTTTRLLELLERAQHDRLTLAEKRRGFGRFPVVGYVWYQDDWAAPRYVPYFHLHEGTDLFARKGTPVIAVADGEIWKLARGGSGGTAVWLMGDDGIRYYYGHLQRIERGLRVGNRVARGDLIATVGNTGTARGTYPHVHFEVNPGGRGTINPKPILDAWLRDAEAAALDRVVLLRRRAAMARFGGARWDALLDLLAVPEASPPPLWALGLDASLGTLLAADRAFDSLLAARDWAALAAPAGASGPVLYDPIAALEAVAQE